MQTSRLRATFDHKPKVHRCTGKAAVFTMLFIGQSGGVRKLGVGVILCSSVLIRDWVRVSSAGARRVPSS